MNTINELLISHFNKTEPEEYHSTDEASDKNDSPNITLSPENDSDSISISSDDYDINDDSDTVYSKARKNATKKTKKIMKKISKKNKN